MMHELAELRKFFASLDRKMPLAATGQGDTDLYSPISVAMAQIKMAISEHEIAKMRVRMRRAGGSVLIRVSRSRARRSASSFVRAEVDGR